MRTPAVALALSLALLSTGMPALAQAPTPAAPYLAMAASADQFELQSIRHALQISQDAEIKSAARMIIADHTRLSAEPTNAASAAGITPPPTALMPHNPALKQAAVKAVAVIQMHRAHVQGLKRGSR